MPDWTGAGAGSLFSTINPFPLGANVTYESVRNADLNTLSGAVDSLSALTAKLTELEQDATAMNGMAHGSLWAGLNATVSRAHIRRTAGKFTHARTQAEALHNILHDLLTDLRGCQDGLLRLEANSEAEGFRISPEGVVSSAGPPHLRLDQLNAGIGMGGIGEPDPEGVSPETQQAMWHAHSRINEIVEKAGESDGIAARALTDILAEGNGRFSHTDLTGIDDARENQVQQDAEAAAVLAGKENKTAADWRLMGDYFALHADDPEFANHVIDTLGMEQYLTLAQELDHSATELASANLDIDGIRTGMANTLNTAMQPSIDISTHPPGSGYQNWLRTEEGQAYERRLNALNALGPERLHEPEEPAWLDSVQDNRIGYDLFLDLMESADAPMNDIFYYDMLDGMVAAEKTDHTIWFGERYSDSGNGWNPKENGTDRLLGIGSQDNIDAVSRFFDPKYNEDNIDYFIGLNGDQRRPLEDSHSHGWGGMLSTDSGLADLAEISNVYGQAPGLTAALEAASTGRPPGGSEILGTEGHSAVNIRIAEHLWNTYAEAPAQASGDLVTPDLRPTLGTIAADYMPDILYAANRSSSGPEDSEASFSRENTGHLLWEVGTHQDSYEKVTAANQAQLYIETDRAVAQYGHEDEADLREKVRYTIERSGVVTGIMTDAHATAAEDEQHQQDARHNEKIDDLQFTVDLLLGGVIYGGMGENPGTAAMAAPVQQQVTDSIFSQFRADNSAAAAAQAEQQYNESGTIHLDNSTAAVDFALERHGIDPASIDQVLLTDAIESGSNGGFEQGTIRKKR
ncbi:hypothetical protein H7827_17150 [Streptomyces sp. JH002]|uniref:hypothetical protein n=1 Tax=Streptomyces sp. JH002 TaxID=2763259 RepID=UPI003D804A44